MTTTLAAPAAVLTCAAVMSTDTAAGRTYTDDLGQGMETFTCPSVTTHLGYVDDGGRGLQLWWAEQAVLSAGLDPYPGNCPDWEAWVRRHKVAGFAALNKAADRGTKVHDAAQRLLMGEADGLSPVYDADAIPFLAALKRFMAEHKPTPVAVEVPIFNRTLGYAGRFDCLATLESMPGRLVLLDWKSRRTVAGVTQARGKEAPQLAAYARGEYMVVDDGSGLHRVAMPAVQAACVVALAPDGAYSVLEVPIDDGVFACFLGALQASPYFMGRPDTKGSPVPATTLTADLEASLAAVGARPPVEGGGVPIGHAHPDTSRTMAAKALPRSGTFQAEIMAHIEARGEEGATDDELELALGRSHQSASASRNVLMNKGWLKDSGKRRLTRYDNEAIVWVVAEPMTAPPEVSVEEVEAIVATALDATLAKVAPAPPRLTLVPEPVEEVDPLVARLEWLRGRARWLSTTNPAALAELAAGWPPGLPALHGGPPHRPDELDRITAAFLAVEARHGVEFYEVPDPVAPPLKALDLTRSVLNLPPKPTAPTTPPSKAPPVPQGVTDAQLLAWIAERYAGLPVDLRAGVTQVAAEQGIDRIRNGATRDQLDTVAALIGVAEVVMVDAITASLNHLADLLAPLEAGEPNAMAEAVAAAAMAASDGRTELLDDLTIEEHTRLRSGLLHP